MNRHKIVLQHTANSSLAGTAQLFSGACVRLGRKPDNDVVFDPKIDLLVSGHHAELRVKDDTLLVVDLGSKNGTFVNGVKIGGSTAVPPGARIALGPDGPEFEVELEIRAVEEEVVEPSNVAAEELAPRRSPKPSSGPSADRRSEDDTPPPSDLLALNAPSPVGRERLSESAQTDPPAGVGGARAGGDAASPVNPAGAANSSHGWGAAETPPLDPALAARVAAARAAAQKPRRTGRRMLVLLVVLLLAATAAVMQWKLGAFAKDSKGLWPFMKKGADSASVTNAAESVYTIVVRGGGGERIVGSAFVVAKDQVATTATIAAVLKKLQPGESAFLKLTATTGATAELRIAGSKSHPNFADASRITAELDPFEPSARGFAYSSAKLASAKLASLGLTPGRSIPPGCDVALLDVEPESTTAPPVVLADDSELAKLKSDSELRVVAGAGATPIAGRFERVANFLGQRPRVVLDPTELITTLDLSALGPAGLGLPIVGAGGHVLGITTGPIVKFPAETDATPHASATRADLLRELMNGKADTASGPRKTAFEAAAMESFRAGTASAEVIARQVGAGIWRARGGDDAIRLDLAEQWTSTALPPKEAPSDDRICAPHASPSAHGGFFVIVAIAIDEPQKVRLGVTAGGKELAAAPEDPALLPRYVCARVFDGIAADSPFQISAVAQAPPPGHPDGQIAFFVLRPPAASDLGGK